MAKALLGTKIGMTSIILPDGGTKAVTLIQATPNTVTRLKTADSDGYQAVQLAAGTAKAMAKPQAGQLAKLKLQPRRLAEFRLASDLAVGDTIEVGAFAEGDTVKVTGISKGKGFAGTIKRHNFHRGPKTHGSRNYRKPGSIGSMYPQKIFKGKKMAGRLGGTTVSVRNLKVALVDSQQHVIGLLGAVPGPRRGAVKIEAL